MADIGLLRQVDMISTVSGGSIIGALYYLHVKDLLENVPDATIDDGHYRAIVKRIENTFLEGVQTNLRARAFAELSSNARMSKRDYSRSDRLGELYDETFYRPAWNNPLFGEFAPREGGMIRLRELRIVPYGHAGEFDPARDNGDRRAPVPVLVLNATTLNTGHNWRFEAVRMGEHPRAESPWLEVDKNVRLKSERWDVMASHQQDFELGLAVAASACVPGLFHPLAVSGLFADPGHEPPERWRIELVDGGVHDNQGVGALVDRDCERIIISDASGQMEDVAEPSTRIHAALGRSSGIYGDRVREEQLIGARLSPRPLRLIHLRKGLPARTLSPVGPNGGVSLETDAGAVNYGPDLGVQELLSKVRTDLDAFTETEAHSLALCGYLMSRVELEEFGGCPVDPATLEMWAFGSLETMISAPTPEYERQLEIASGRFFKAAKVSGAGKARLAVVVVVALVILAAAAMLLHSLGLLRLIGAVLSAPLPVWATALVAGGLVGVLTALYLKPKFRVPGARWVADRLYGRVVPLVMAPGLYLAARAIRFMDRAFLKGGRLETLFAKSPTQT